VDHPSDADGEDYATISMGEDLEQASGRLPEPRPEPLDHRGAVERLLVDDGEMRILVREVFTGAVVRGGSSADLAPGPVAGSIEHIPGSLARQPGSLGQVPGSPGHLPGSLGPQPGSPAGGPLSPGMGQVEHATAPGDVRFVTPHGEHPLLQASVELVISGQAVPGARLTVAGRDISAGPDGGFSLRISVPEGIREIPIEAEQVSGDRRRINLRFGRETD
jgi:hypothetical protein